MDKINEIIDIYGIDKDEAEEVLNIAEELGVDYDEAYEIWEGGGI